MQRKIKTIAAALAMAAFAGVVSADSGTITANGTVQAGCQLVNSNITVTLPASTTVSLNNGTAITQTGNISVNCTSGVNGTISLGATAMQNLDINGDSAADVEAYLYSGTSCGSGAWPQSFTGTGSAQNIPFCVKIIKKSGVTVPAGTINVSWPITVSTN
jgi:hypothetical protein